MDDVEEKRVYAGRSGGTELVVAAAIGVVVVDVSRDRVGRFGVVHRCTPADVAAADGRIAVAADEDVLVREPDEEAFAATGFGRALAIDLDDGGLVAAAPDGRVARLSDARTSDGEPAWSDLGRLDVEVRAIDGPLLAAADGVYRLPGLAYAGLDDARDVAAAGPLAATGRGLYTLGNGWIDELAGEFRVVGAADERAHAATTEDLFEREPNEWREVELPVTSPVVDVAYGDVPYAVTADGVLLAASEDGWGSHSLGVEGVSGLAVA